MSDEADPLYRPLGGLEPWAAAPVDERSWSDAVDRLRALRDRDPDWMAMVGHGALLAAAHQSGALDSVHGADVDVAHALLRGEATLAAVGQEARPHVRANVEAMRLAKGGQISEAAIRRIHEVACRPQHTHRVRVDDRIQDHVLAGGDYKHHPNHLLIDAGAWVATAPVALVRPEMSRVVETADSPTFAALHPVAQAAFLHHALTHVQPFADGNGRVARALAGGCLLRAASIPFLVFASEAGPYEEARGPDALVELVQRAAIGLVDLLSGLHDAGRAGEALERWRRQEETARAVRAALPPAVDEALRRYGRRSDRPRESDLSGAATVLSDEGLRLRVPLGSGASVDEVLTVDAHPLEGDAVVLTAEEASLRIGPGDPLVPWLDRVMSVLALRVAAELE
jgi:hypothetical protein